MLMNGVFCRKFGFIQCMIEEQDTADKSFAVNLL